jgi:hypothetical protein
VRRVIAVTACCLVAALIPFYAGAPAAVLGLVPLAVAIWLVSRSGWSSHTRVTASVTVLVATIALVIGLLALSALTSHYN